MSVELVSLSQRTLHEDFVYMVQMAMFIAGLARRFYYIQGVKN